MLLKVVAPRAMSAAFALTLLTSLAADVAAQPGRGGAADPTPAPAATPAAREPQGPTDRLSATSGSVTIGGMPVKYTATAGTLGIKNAAGKVRANVFFVAYTRDGEPAKNRPVAFVFNGGPGSASVWLHMGLVGPKRVQMASEGFQPAPPYSLVDNEESILDVCDVVAIDAVSTGYSRPAEGEDPKTFHGVRQDIEAFGDFIRHYITKYNRWTSPKYLLGESYGTVRSAGLAADMQSRLGIELNGIILVSSVIDFLTIRAEAPGNELIWAANLPTYTATAWYHKRLPQDLQSGTLDNAVQAARNFVWGEYTTALVAGSRLSAAERRAVAAKVARFTGLPADFVEQSNLRVSPGRFRKELLRDKRLVVGRLDGRFTAMDRDAAGENQEFDPSNTALQGAYTPLFLDYVRRDLKWESDLQYLTSGNVNPWEYEQGRALNLTENLRSAMARNPFLKVFVANGYYDSATPFAGTEYTFDHLGYEDTYKERVSMGYYEGGHMMYIHPQELKDLKRDMAKFIVSTKDSPTAQK